MASEHEAKTFEDILSKPELDKALEDLARIAYRLKESGLLDMLVVLAEKYEEILQGLTDQRTLHALALVQAFLDGVREADPWKYKPAIQLMTHCVFESMDPGRLSNAKPVGLMGLLSALRDPDVSFGLGLLIAMAKSLGGCMRREMNRQMKVMDELGARDFSRRT